MPTHRSTRRTSRSSAHAILSRRLLDFITSCPQKICWTSKMQLHKLQKCQRLATQETKAGRVEIFIKRKRQIQHAPFKHAGATPKTNMNRKLRVMKREIDIGQ